MPWFQRLLAFEANPAGAPGGALRDRLPERLAAAAPRTPRRLPHGQLWGCSYRAPALLSLLESDHVRIKLPLAGTARMVAGRRHLILCPTRGAVAGTGARLEFDGGYEQLALRLPVDLLVRKLAALAGDAVTGGLEFEPEIDFATPAGRSLRNLMLCMAAAAGDLEGPMAAHVLAEIEQSFVVALLCTAEHSQRARLERKVPAAAPWQVRRVESYIEAHWRDPLRIEDIATAAGVSARSIFRTFAEHRGYSPKEFQKRLRLRHAHNLLRDAAAGSTVTDIALECGFGDLSRFSKDYAAAFGEAPSATLRAARHGPETPPETPPDSFAAAA